MFARFSECVKRWMCMTQQKCMNNTQSVVSMLQLVGWSVKEKKDTAQTVEILFCQFVLLQLHFMHSPWSVNSQSVETHLLDFCLHLSLQRREKKNPPWVTFYLSVCCRVGQVSSSSVPSLWGTGSCFLNRLPWRTWGGTASSLLIWRAQLIWLWNRGQHGKIHPEETKY